MTWIMDPLTIYRYITYVYLFRTVASLGVAAIVMYLMKDKQSLFIFTIGTLTGVVFECMANLIGLRTYVPDDVFHNLVLIGVLGLEIGGATAMAWAISSIIYKRPENWKRKVLLWAGVLVCMMIIFPLLAGG